MDSTAEATVEGPYMLSQLQLLVSLLIACLCECPASTLERGTVKSLSPPSLMPLIHGIVHYMFHENQESRVSGVTRTRSHENQALAGRHLQQSTNVRAHWVGSGLTTLALFCIQQITCHARYYTQLCASLLRQTRPLPIYLHTGQKAPAATLLSDSGPVSWMWPSTSRRRS